MDLSVEFVSIFSTNSVGKGNVSRILTASLVSSLLNVDGVYQIKSVMKQESKLTFVKLIHGITRILIIINLTFATLSSSLKMFRVLILSYLFIKPDHGSSLALLLLKSMLRPIKSGIN